jgi:cytochrome c
MRLAAHCPLQHSASGLNVIPCVSKLMHCLPLKAGLALGSVLTAWGLSAFFVNAHAQSQEAVTRGLAIYTAKCSACHSVDENRVGPAHAGVLGRRAGKAKDYEYSEALAKSKVIWNRANLERWLTDPEKVIPGQRMGYRLSLPQERADVVAYLATLSTSK